MLQILWDAYCSDYQHFGSISFVSIECRKSSRINTTLAVNGLTPLLILRLDHQDAIARLNLLKLIKVKFCNPSPSPLTFVSEKKKLLVSHTVLDEMESIYPSSEKKIIIWLWFHQVGSLIEGLEVALHVWFLYFSGNHQDLTITLVVASTGFLPQHRGITSNVDHCCLNC